MSLKRKLLRKRVGKPNIGYHGVFSTHPDHDKRINALGKLKAQDSKNKSNKEKFLKLLDGSVYGSSPEEGYVKNSIFYHPVLAIKFNINE